MNRTEMQPGTYTAVQRPVLDALRAQLERLGIETAGKDADALVAAAVGFLDHEEVFDEPGRTWVKNDRLAMLEAALDLVGPLQSQRGLHGKEHPYISGLWDRMDEARNAYEASQGEGQGFTASPEKPESSTKLTGPPSIQMAGEWILENWPTAPYFSDRDWWLERMQEYGQYLKENLIVEPPYPTDAELELAEAEYCEGPTGTRLLQGGTVRDLEPADPNPPLSFEEAKEPVLKLLQETYAAGLESGMRLERICPVAHDPRKEGV